MNIDSINEVDSALGTAISFVLETCQFLMRDPIFNVYPVYFVVIK